MNDRVVEFPVGSVECFRRILGVLERYPGMEPLEALYQSAFWLPLAAHRRPSKRAGHTGDDQFDAMIALNNAYGTTIEDLLNMQGDRVKALLYTRRMLGERG